MQIHDVPKYFFFKSQSNKCFKIISKLVCHCYIIKIIVGDYNFKFFEIIKTLIDDSSF